MEQGLEKLHLVHARLLYIFAEMFREGYINDDQRHQLKQFLFEDDPKLMQLYEQNLAI